MGDVDGVYRERNLTFLALMALARRTGATVGVRVDPTEPDWPVLCIAQKDGAGELSIHVPAKLIEGLEFDAYPHAYDGSTKEDVTARLWTIVRDEFSNASSRD